MSSVKLKDFGAVGDGVTDDTAAFQAFAAFTVANNREWLIEEGMYRIDPAAPIEMRTGGTCRGVLLFPRSNPSATIRFTRDIAGTTVNVTGWALDQNKLHRGQMALSATNAKNKVVYISSTEVLIEREGGSVYTKQELVKILDDGSASRPLVHTYNNASSDVVATAHEPSRAVRVDGLEILLVGSGHGATFGTLRIERDYMHFADLKIRVEGDLAGANGVDHGVSVFQCYAPLFTDPVIEGFTGAGLGYGIIFSGTLGYVVSNGKITECRHAISGRHNVDGSVLGGSFQHNLDDHWGDNWYVEGVTCNTAQGDAGFMYAGNDIRLIDCTVYGGRTFLLQRSDTPYLGGVVDIIRPRWYSSGEESTIYGIFATQGAYNGPFTNLPRDPDVINIDSPTMHCDVMPGQAMYLVSTDGDRTASYVPIGKLNLSGVANFGGRSFHSGLLLFKGAAIQNGRGTQVTISGRYAFGAGNIAYVIAHSSATNAAQAHTLTMSGTQGSLRFHPRALMTVSARDCTIEAIDVDGVAGNFDSASRYRFHGGTISTRIGSELRNAIFSGVNFTGVLADFPATGVAPTRTSQASLVGSFSDVAQPMMPPDLLATLVAPFDGQV